MSTTTEEPRVGRDHAISRFAGAAIEAITQVTETPTWTMSRAELRQALVDLDHLGSMLTELRLRVLAAADHGDGVGAESGASSTASWLAHATHQTRSRTGADLRLALALDDRFEATRKALAAGRVNEDQVRVIVAAIDDLPDDLEPVWRARAEQHLLEQALLVDARTLRILGRRIFEVLDPETADEREGKKLEEEERRARARTRFAMRDNGDGTHTATFTVPDLHAAVLKKALQALAAPRRTGEARLDPDTGRKLPYPDLLGQALCELLERYPSDRLPSAGGTSATIVVTISHHSLLTGLGAATLDDGTRISASEARRLACEAGIIPLVLGGDSVPLDVGRERRLHDRYQRLAMASRDRGCTAENCDRPPSWAEAHHDLPWSQGGATDLAHGRLLCHHHHQLAHHVDYHVDRLPQGKLRFTRRH